MKRWARLIHSNVSSRQSPRSFDFHVTRNSNRNWHSGMPLAASIIYLYTRKIHGRAHTFSLSTIHETSRLLWPFDQQYFCMKQEQSCVPVDQRAYSELMRSGHRKHVSFGLEVSTKQAHLHPSIDLMHLHFTKRPMACTSEANGPHPLLSFPKHKRPGC